jgi:hypothetical protein
MPLEKMTEAAARRVVGMRGNDQAGRLGPSECRHVIKAVDPFSCRIKIEQQHVFVLDRAFDAGDQRNTARPRVFGQLAHVEPAIVQRNRQYVIPQCSCAVDQVGRRIRDVIVWVG